MTAKQVIEAAMAYAGLTMSQVAENLGTSPQAFASKLKSGKFTLEEWGRIAEAMGAKFTTNFFTFQDGKQI